MLSVQFFSASWRKEKRNHEARELILVMVEKAQQRRKGEDEDEDI